MRHALVFVAGLVQAKILRQGRQLLECRLALRLDASLVRRNVTDENASVCAYLGDGDGASFEEFGEVRPGYVEGVGRLLCGELGVMGNERDGNVMAASPRLVRQRIIAMFATRRGRW
jgi:hypothetical protein